MIISDTDILSALAKVGRMPLLLSLFNTTELHITPGVFSEIEHSFVLVLSNESRVAHICRVHM
jgi:predicted nucleic acid-binding protein